MNALAIAIMLVLNLSDITAVREITITENIEADAYKAIEEMKEEMLNKGCAGGNIEVSKKENKLIIKLDCTKLLDNSEKT